MFHTLIKPRSWTGGTCGLRLSKNAGSGLVSCSPAATRAARRHPIERVTGDGAAIFRHACSLGFEGILSKRVGSRYVSGRTRAWLKTKNPDFDADLGDDPSFKIRPVCPNQQQQKE